MARCGSLVSRCGGILSYTDRRCNFVFTFVPSQCKQMQYAPRSDYTSRCYPLRVLLTHSNLYCCVIVLLICSAPRGMFATLQVGTWNLLLLGLYLLGCATSNGVRLLAVRWVAAAAAAAAVTELASPCFGRTDAR